MSGTTIKDILIAAEAAQRSGDLARAAALYRDVLTHMPKHSRAKKALAKIERKGGSAKPRLGQGEADQLANILGQGDFAGAVAMADQLTDAFRDEAFVHNIRGIALTHLGESDEAVKAYRWAVKLDPGFIDALGNLGALYTQMGRFEEAEKTLRKALSKRESWPEAHHNLGSALTALGRNDGALRHYSRAIEIRPNYANAHNSRGTLHLSQGNAVDAVADFQVVVAHQPTDAGAHARLSGALSDIGDFETSLQAIDAALALEPENRNFLLKKGLTLNEFGRKEDARQVFRNLLVREPDHAEALRLSYELFEGDEKAQSITHMEDMLKRDSLDDEDRVQLSFALGQHYDRVSDVVAASMHLIVANGTNRALLPPPPETDTQMFARIRKLFERGSFDHLLGKGSQDERPVFVIGMMRSGTTLVEQIISSHSKGFGAGELMAATNLAPPIYAAGRKAGRRDLLAFADAYLAQSTVQAGDAMRIVDKMPGNFMNVGLLHLAFPKARIVHMVRDPRDSGFSIWKNFFDTHAHQYAYDQAELAQFANNYLLLMQMWDDLYPGAVYHLRYEDLVADQEAESRKLIAHLGLDWEPGVLEFHKTERVVRTASVNQVRQKIYKSSVKSWEPYSDHLQVFLETLDQSLFEKTGGPAV
ncbi:MAG: sulfotransferase [Pseudomonadota bacterium]